MVLASQPIGIFDSGVGGLTVMQQLIETLPNERFVYFGDTARVPYGNKSPETIIRYCIENTIFLLKKNIKLLIVACNTASAFALPKLQQLFNIPIVGVINGGAKRAVTLSSQSRIAVLGTKGTIASNAYQSAIYQLAPDAFVLPLSCPLLVPLVEEGWLDHLASRLILQEYLKPIQEQQIDTILLGCTHYPLLSSLIQEEVGEKMIIVDSASTCAAQTAQLLHDHKILSPIKLGVDQYFVSDDPEKFSALAERLFYCPPSSAELVTEKR